MKLTSSIRLKPDLLYVAPLLNLVLLLLIFFVLNTNMVVRSGISVELPESNSALPPIQDPDFLTLTAGPTPAIFLNKTPVTWETLGESIRKSTSKGRHVILNADPLVPYGQVMRAKIVVLDAGRELSEATQLSP